uniref:Uncharacterized protein n=1 Tax=Rhizophora mucronata TaxID=61149 RepID=A0A2P2LFA9_RHIMU
MLDSPQVSLFPPPFFFFVFAVDLMESIRALVSGFQTSLIICPILHIFPLLSARNHYFFCCEICLAVYN